MKRTIIQIKAFSKTIDSLIEQKKLLNEDYISFEQILVENPEDGSLITGTGGVRKTRLKSAYKGKRGGFRVCYFDDPNNQELFLILLYPKNEQETLSAQEKKMLKELTNMIKQG